MMNYKDNCYIIDTDIGDDIDDAMAIGMALKMKGYNIVGVTTVFKNTGMRARLARKLLIDAGRKDIPVYAGSGNGIINTYNENEIFNQYSEDLLDSIYDYDYSKSADVFIAEAAKKYGKSLVIVCIGALTNIAMAITKYPNEMERIAGLCIMGGAFWMHCNEWNIKCDPEAAKIVCDSAVTKKFAGLDITSRTQLTKEELEYALNMKGKVSGAVAGLIRKWHDATNSLPYMHDELAVYTSAFPMETLDCDGIVKYSAVRMDISTQGITRGTTFNITTDNWHTKRGIPANVFVAAEVDVAKFKDYYFITITD